MRHRPVQGGAAPRAAVRTARKLSSFALRHVESITPPRVTWSLDVGCGNGSITTQFATAFERVVGIDVERERLSEFQHLVRDDQRFNVLWMSADGVGFRDGTFCLVTAFEVLEHVPDLQGSADEMVRVCKPGGVVVVSVPQVWFPFENHGMYVNGRTIDKKIPLLPYIRPLHRKFAAARLFSSTEMDALFVSRGLELLETAYAAPQFERAAMGQSWERHFVFLRGVLDRCEHMPVLRELTGVSMLKAYRKPV
jgi:SAM-dependent methyltransferase